jgi:hypothetical protein
MVDEDADVEAAVARLKARLEQEGFHLPIGPEANQQRLFEVEVSLLSEQLTEQLRELQAMNDARESWLGRAWNWERSHSEDDWWPPPSVLESARAAQDSALKSCLGLLRMVDWAQAAFGRAAQQAEGLGEASAAARPPEFDVLVDAVARLIEGCRRSAWHFAVLRPTNPLYELWRVRTSDDPAVIDEALDGLVAGEYRKPINPKRWRALYWQLRKGIAPLGKMLELPSQDVVPKLARVLLASEIPQSLASTPAEMIQDLKQRLNRLVTDALVPPEHLDQPPAEEVSIETFGGSIYWDARAFDPTTAAQRLAIGYELAQNGAEALALMRATRTHGGLVALAKEEGVQAGAVRKRLFDMRRRLKGRTAVEPRRGAIPTRSLATTPWVSGFVNYPGHGPLDRHGDVLMPSGLPGQRYARAGVIGVEVGLRYVDLDVFTVYHAEVAGPRAVPQPPSVEVFCPSCGELVVARGEGRRCVAATKKGPRLCATCGKRTCSHAPWCRARKHQHHFKPQGASDRLTCVECAATLSTAEVKSSS